MFKSLKVRLVMIHIDFFDLSLGAIFDHLVGQIQIPLLIQNEIPILLKSYQSNENKNHSVC